MEKRVVKRSIAGVLITAMLVMMMLPMSVSAELFKTLKPGKWATSDVQYYKIIVKKSGILSFTTSGDTRLYSDREAAYDSEAGYYYVSSNSMAAVDKGTYYLDVINGKCKYRFTPSSAPANYSIARAKSLKANKKVYNVLTPKTNYIRWFKISNPKKKKIIICSNDPENIIILNSRLKRFPTIAYGSKVKYCTKKVLPKGTYYIGVKRWSFSEYEDNGIGRVTSLLWK